MVVEYEIASKSLNWSWRWKHLLSSNNARVDWFVPTMRSLAHVSRVVMSKYAHILPHPPSDRCKELPKINSSSQFTRVSHALCVAYQHSRRPSKSSAHLDAHPISSHAVCIQVFGTDDSAIILSTTAATMRQLSLYFRRKKNVKHFNTFTYFEP